MRRRAPVPELSEGTADDIPFGAHTFDLVFSVDVIHHVSDSKDYFEEAKRILAPTGKLCTVTDSTQMIRNRRPLSYYWPASVEVDIERYPRVDSLRDQMQEAGFRDIETMEISAPFTFHDAAAYREKAFSCLRMIAEQAIQEGLERLESDLRYGAIDGLTEYVCIWGTA